MSKFRRSFLFSFETSFQYLSFFYLTSLPCFESPLKHSLFSSSHWILIAFFRCRNNYPGLSLEVTKTSYRDWISHEKLGKNNVLRCRGGRTLACCVSWRSISLSGAQQHPPKAQRWRPGSLPYPPIHFVRRIWTKTMYNRCCSTTHDRAVKRRDRGEEADERAESGRSRGWTWRGWGEEERWGEGVQCMLISNANKIGGKCLKGFMWKWLRSKWLRYTQSDVIC